MKAGYIIFFILAINVVFIYWPGTSQFKQSEYESVSLSSDEIDQAILQYKKQKYLFDIGYYKQMFLFSNVPCSMEQYVWMLTLRLTLIVIAYRWAMRANEDEVDFIKLLVVITILDLADHLIHYNEKYFSWGVFDISFNTVSFLVYGFFLGYKKWQSSH